MSLQSIHWFKCSVMLVVYQDLFLVSLSFNWGLCAAILFRLAPWTRQNNRFEKIKHRNKERKLMKKGMITRLWYQSLKISKLTLKHIKIPFDHELNWIKQFDFYSWSDPLWSEYLGEVNYSQKQKQKSQ